MVVKNKNLDIDRKHTPWPIRFMIIFFTSTTSSSSSSSLMMGSAPLTYLMVRPGYRAGRSLLIKAATQKAIYIATIINSGNTKDFLLYVRERGKNLIQQCFIFDGAAVPFTASFFIMVLELFWFVRCVITILSSLLMFVKLFYYVREQYQ